MKTIQIEVSRELAERYIALHQQVCSDSTISRSVEEFLAAFVEERLIEETNFLENELAARR